MNDIKKWVFGAAPLKPDTKEKYKNSLIGVKTFFLDYSIPLNEDLLNSISIVKGMFNRILRQDQWDWFTVNMYLDYPETKEVYDIVNLLLDIRKDLKNLDMPKAEEKIEKILRTNFVAYIDSFLDFDFKKDTDDYIYILSQKSEKKLLKIGMTTRNVIKRCNEINSATGVVFPFSPRKVYRVKDAIIAERKVHEELDEYRIRADREFFYISYAEACKRIEKVLKETKLFYYKY